MICVEKLSCFYFVDKTDTVICENAKAVCMIEK